MSETVILEKDTEIVTENENKLPEVVTTIAVPPTALTFSVGNDGTTISTEIKPFEPEVVSRVDHDLEILALKADISTLQAQVAEREKAPYFKLQGVSGVYR